MDATDFEILRLTFWGLVTFIIMLVAFRRYL